MEGRPRFTHSLLLCFVIVQFTIGVMGSLDSRISILEVLFGNVIKGNIDSIKTRLDNLEKKEDYSDNGVDETVLKDKLQEIADNVNTKTNRMLAAFSVEKEELHNLKKSIVEEVKDIEQPLEDMSKQIDRLDKKIQGIDRHGNETSEHVRLIDSQIEVIDKQVDNIIKQVENTNGKVGSIDLQVANIANQVGGIDGNLNDIDKQVKNIDKQVKDNVESIQDIDDGIAAIKTDIGNLKKNVKTAEKKNCPQGWKRQLNSCILYVREEMGWIGARNYCQRKGANLVEPISQYALQVLTEQLPSSRDRWWIGASDRSNEGRWVWESSGKPIGDVNWNTGEPNNEGGHEDCMELIFDSNFNDQTCGSDANIICEIKL